MNPYTLVYILEKKKHPSTKKKKKKKPKNNKKKKTRPKVTRKKTNYR